MLAEDILNACILLLSTPIVKFSFKCKADKQLTSFSSSTEPCYKLQKSEQVTEMRAWAESCSLFKINLSVDLSLSRVDSLTPPT